MRGKTSFLLMVVSVITILVFSFFLFGCGEGNPSGTDTSNEQNVSPAEPEDEIAWKLAVIKTGNRDLPYDDMMVMQFKGYLDSLEKKTNQTRIEISDMTVRTWQILQEEVNPDEDLLSVIHDLNDSIPDDLDVKLDLPGVAAAYIVLRQGE